MPSSTAKVSSTTPEIFDALDAIAPEAIPGAIARLAARAMMLAQVVVSLEKTVDKLLDADAAATLLGVSRRFVYIHARELGAIRLGGGIRGRLRFSRVRLMAKVSK